MKLSVIILAAGEGTRLKSSTPKVLHEIGGKPLLLHVLETAFSLLPDKLCVVVGHKAGDIKARFAGSDILWAHQDNLLGTGDAVATALPHVGDATHVLVLCGDTPLVSSATLQTLVESASDDSISIVTADCEDPASYGRILRDASGDVTGIIEAKDASDEELVITEINSGIALFPVALLETFLPKLSQNNASGELYLTDVIGLAVEAGITVHGVQTNIEEEVLGINTKAQLAEAESIYQALQTEYWMAEGVTFRDPARFDVRGDLSIARDVTIDINVICEGDVEIGEGTTVGPNVVLHNTKLGKHVEIRGFCHIEGAEIQDGAIIGPFARVRPDTVVGDNARIGNFVEIKKSIIGAGSKVSHLSYVGDATLGQDVNIGAGTITCNYDGANKHQTVIEDNVFVGSNTALVAPINIGEGATLGAGSTISKDAPRGSLTVSRATQRTIANWARPSKEDKA